jgi:hypothetical protein
LECDVHLKILHVQPCVGTAQAGHSLPASSWRAS